MHDPSSHSHSQTIEFPRETEGLPEAGRTELVELADGDEFELEIKPVKKRIGDATVRMLTYNGSVPGPTLKVPQGATITVHVRTTATSTRPCTGTACDREPLRRNTRDTGADPGRRDLHLPGARARPRRLLVPPTYPRGLRTRDGPVRNILVDPERARLLAAGEPRAATHPRRRADRGWADRRLQRVGDDARRDGPLRQRDAHRRRAGPVARAQRGEVVRFYFTNTANTRVFNVDAAGRADEAGRRRRRPLRARGARRGGAASTVRARRRRRAVSGAGELTLEHRTPERTYRLASITVTDQPAEAVVRRRVRAAATNRDMAGRTRADRAVPDSPPDKTLSFVAEMDMGVPEGVPVVYVCPMHPEVISDEPGSCPKCGMKLLAQAAEETTYVCPMHPEVTSDKADRCPKCGMKLLPASLVAAAVSGATSTTATTRARARRHGHPARGPRRATTTRPKATGNTRRARRTTTISTARPTRARHRAGDRVGRRHGRGQPDDHSGQHALEARRP